MGILNVYSGDDCLWTWRANSAEVQALLDTIPLTMRVDGFTVPPADADNIIASLSRDRLEAMEPQHRLGILNIATWRLLSLGMRGGQIADYLGAVEFIDVDIAGDEPVVRSGIKLNA